MLIVAACVPILRVSHNGDCSVPLKVIAYNSVNYFIYCVCEAA